MPCGIEGDEEARAAEASSDLAPRELMQEMRGMMIRAAALALEMLRKEKADLVSGIEEV